MKVLNFGSLNIDFVYSVDHFVQKGETIASSDLHTYSGGKGLNQSVALGRSGVPTFHAGAIGKDGQFLIDILHESGVNTDHIEVRDDVRTGNAIIQNDKSGDNCIILFGGANRSIRKEQVDKTLSDFSEGDYLLVQNEIDQLPYIITQAHKKGMTIILNPSPMDDTILELALESINWFVLNEIEAGQILGIKDPDASRGKELAEKLKRKFPGSHIVLTLGNLGSIYAYQDEYYQQKCYEVKTVDTTAAGDTFTGYLINGIIMGKSIEKTMDIAARASAITVTTHGAAPSIPTMEQVKRYKF